MKPSIIFRRLLQEVDRHLTTGGAPLWRSYICEIFRQNRGTSTTDPRLLVCAEEYLDLVRSVHGNKVARAWGYGLTVLF